MKKYILLFSFFILISCSIDSNLDEETPPINSGNTIIHEDNSTINDSIYVDNLYIVKGLENVNQLSSELTGNNTLTLYRGQEGIDREYLYIEEKRWQELSNETLINQGTEVRFQGIIKLLVGEIDNYHYIAENIEKLSLITE